MKQKMIQLNGAIIIFPEPGADNYPRIILNNGNEIVFDQDAKRAFLDWGHEDEAAIDLLGYADDIRNEVVERYDSISADVIEENIEEIVEYYVAARWNDGGYAKNAVDSFAYYNGFEDRGNE